MCILNPSSLPSVLSGTIGIQRWVAQRVLSLSLPQTPSALGWSLISSPIECPSRTSATRASIKASVSQEQVLMLHQTSVSCWIWATQPCSPSRVSAILLLRLRCGQSTSSTSTLLLGCRGASLLTSFSPLFFQASLLTYSLQCFILCECHAHGNNKNR